MSICTGRADLGCFGGYFEAGIANAVGQAFAASIVLVAGAGNNGGNTVVYPPGLSEVIGVSGVKRNLEFAASSPCEILPGSGIPASSNWGAHVDLAARFWGRTTHGPSSYGGDDESWCRTSFATPLVLGVAALVRARNPTLSAAQVRSISFDTHDRGDPFWDPYFGYGVVNAYAAVWATPTPPPPLVATITGPSQVQGWDYCTWWASSTGGSGTTSYQWYKNGNQVSTSHEYATTVTGSFLLELRIQRGSEVDWDEINVSVSGSAPWCSI